MTWEEVFKNIKSKDYAARLSRFLDEEYAHHKIYPERKNMFNAFKLTPLEDVKVVIFGQDPYHEEGQAMGLAFSVPDNIKTPPSLINIYKEIEIEYKTLIFNKGGDLTYLAKQGVLLLNSILSVRAHQAMSHNTNEYKMFLARVLEVLDKQTTPIVFLLWGGPARKLKGYLHNPSHLILECIHPSPLAANHGGWFGNNHFKEANRYLREHGLSEINWLNN